MTMPTLQRHALPAGLHTLADHETLAQQRLDPAHGAYISGGAGDETTLRANHDAWQQWLLRPRVLKPLAGLHTRTRLLGRDWPSPVLVAPMACHRLAHPDGEHATAVAAAALGVGMVLSTQTSTPPEQVAALYLHDTDRGPLWFQLYGHNDRGWMRELLQRVHQTGYEAIVVTADAPLQGVRDRERRAGFQLPAGLCALDLPSPATPGVPALLAQALQWDDLAWLVAEAGLPVLVKGILHPDDAQQAVRLGAAGVVVSNHGGRTLDTALPTALALPAIADALQGDAAVLVDGGIRRGTDVLKALALGAHAVLLGRPVLYGLANAGAAGVAHVLRLLQDELHAAMALCGVTAPAQARPGLLHPNPATAPHFSF
ncbi:alpha-hydroxy acid oxidase [Macromonas bipunctata]|uniref:alpha-hydroxy acid oxidase n=1 Tax=Macromonas bipunctata TaxID=183670 RepID=UPI000C31CB76|nr:alpha-hydroxy acid oxidase [Macromonas bipunctata]